MLRVGELAPIEALRTLTCTHLHPPTEHKRNVPCQPWASSCTNHQYRCRHQETCLKENGAGQALAENGIGRAMLLTHHAHHELTAALGILTGVRLHQVNNPPHLALTIRALRAKTKLPRDRRDPLPTASPKGNPATTPAGLSMCRKLDLVDVRPAYVWVLRSALCHARQLPSPLFGWGRGPDRGHNASFGLGRLPRRNKKEVN